MNNSKTIFLKSCFAVIFLSCCSTKKQAPNLHEKRIDFTVKAIASPFNKISDTFKHLIPVIQKIYINDQKYRENNDYQFMYKNRQAQFELDSINKIIVDSLFKVHGFLGKKELGYLGFMPIILTLIHADTNFKYKYQQVIDEQFKQQNVSPQYYAMFVDKLLAQKRQFQKYGTQFLSYNNNKNVFYPFNPAQIAKDRASIGLKEVLFKNQKDSLKYIFELPELMKYLNIK